MPDGYLHGGHPGPGALTAKQWNFLATCGQTQGTGVAKARVKGYVYSIAKGSAGS